MKGFNSWGVIFCLVALAIQTSATGYAQSDSPKPTLSVNPDEDVQVVYAVYGGVSDDKTASHRTNVTDKVADLLAKSADGFSVTEDILTGKHSTDLVPSLIIVYNYQKHSYFYNIVEGGGTVSSDKLKSWANTEKSARIGGAIDAPTNGSFRVVFAAYGCGDMFLNSTDRLRKLLHDQPDGFIPTDSSMGGDPHPSWSKELIVIFDDPSGRHLYTMFNVGPHVSRVAIMDAAKSN